jgi:hypothetical protein
LLFAARPALLTRVLGVVTRALSTSMLRRAGLSVRSGAKTGIVTAIQRFGSNLGLNVHLLSTVIQNSPVVVIENSPPGG